MCSHPLPRPKNLHRRPPDRGSPPSHHPVIFLLALYGTMVVPLLIASMATPAIITSASSWERSLYFHMWQQAPVAPSPRGHRRSESGHHSVPSPPRHSQPPPAAAASHRLLRAPSLLLRSQPRCLGHVLLPVPNDE